MKNLVIMQSQQDLNSILTQLQLEFELFDSIPKLTKKYNQMYDTVDKIVISDTVLNSTDNMYATVYSIRELLDTNMLKYKKLYFLVSNANTKEDLIQIIEHIFPEVNDNGKDYLNKYSKSLSAIELCSVILEKEDIKLNMPNTYEELIISFKYTDSSVFEHKQLEGSEAQTSILKTANYKAVQDFNSRRQLLSKTSSDLIKAEQTSISKQIQSDTLSLIPETLGDNALAEETKHIVIIGTSTSGRTTLTKYLLSSLTNAKKTVMCYDLTKHSCLEDLSKIANNPINYVNLDEMKNNSSLLLEHIQDCDNHNTSVIVGNPDYVQEYMRIIRNTEVVSPNFTIQVADIEDADKLLLSEITTILVPFIPTRKHLMRTLNYVVERCIDIRNCNIKLVPSGVFGDIPQIQGVSEEEIVPLLTKEVTKTNYIKNNVTIVIGETVYIPDPEFSQMYLAEELLDTKLQTEEVTE